MFIEMDDSIYTQTSQEVMHAGMLFDRQDQLQCNVVYKQALFLLATSFENTCNQTQTESHKLLRALNCIWEPATTVVAEKYGAMYHANLVRNAPT